MVSLSKLMILSKRQDKSSIFSLACVHPDKVKNYRPVAILCILSKVIERIIFIQVVEYMSSNDYFHPNHHGFRAGHVTTTAMIQMYNSWVQAVDKG